MFLLVGLVRNCAAVLRADVERLGAALAGVAELHWLLVESDSADDSVEVLEGLAGQVENFRYVTLGALESQLPLRSERIAHCRNVYLEAICGDVAYAAVDYVIVADFDGLNALITRAGIDSCWARDDWDVCTANQQGNYYDVWALRHSDWSPNDCWAQAHFLVVAGDTLKAVYAGVYSRMNCRRKRLGRGRLSISAGWRSIKAAPLTAPAIRDAMTGAKRSRACSASRLPVQRRTDFHQSKKASKCRGGRTHQNPRAAGHQRRTKSPGLNRRSRQLHYCWTIIPTTCAISEPAVERAPELAHRPGQSVEQRNALFGGLTNKQIFTKIYAEQHWGTPEDPGDRFYSGTGSHEASIIDTYVGAVKFFLSHFTEKPSVVDLGCGDFSVGSKIRDACGHIRPAMWLTRSSPATR